MTRELRRGEAGYEEARRAAVWNARLPSRYPDVIVQAKNVYDVVAAIRLAKRERLRVGVRSGGHSWAANHVRDGGLLLDVSAMNEVTVDVPGRTATTGPGRKGHELAGLLAKRGLFFPSGHCRGVAVGGYLLQGGFGWHSRTLGPACMSVTGLDLVTADGDIVFASERENADLYWAARGAGPGFFGVVTRFHLRVYPRPAVIGFAGQTYPLSKLEEVFRWAHAVGPEVPASVELQLMVSQSALGAGGPGVEVLAPVFADSYAQARRDTAFLTSAPMRAHAALKVPFLPTGLPLLYRGVGLHYPDDHRYAVDNMWTSAPIDALLPGLLRIAETMPPPPTHMLWLNWAPPKSRPDMAFSMEDDLYLACYAVWKSAADDERHARWPADRMREMERLATGCQLADENLAERPAKFVSDAHLTRLDEIRAARDPEGRFHPWMGRPSAPRREERIAV